MNIMLTTALTLARVMGLGLIAAAAQAEAAIAAKSDHECVFTVQSKHWRVLDKEQIVLFAPSQKDAYLVTLFAPLNDLPFTISLAFIDSDRNGMICGNSNDKIAVPDSHTGSWPTSIKSMTRLDEADLLALGEKYKVKLLPAKRLKELEAAK